MENREYLIVGDKIIITDENGMRDPVPFVNNFKDIEIVETVMKYLQEQLKRDQADLESKLSERKMRLEDYKKSTLLATGASLVIPPAVSLLTGLHQQEVTNLFGQMNGAVSFSISAIPALIVGSQLLLSYGLSLRPSKNDINGKEEKIKYEEELLKELTSDLVKLKLDTNSDKLSEYEDGSRGIIDVSSVIKYSKDSIGLRYAFGSQFKKIMKLHNSGELHDYLLDAGIDPYAANDFVQFIDCYEHDINFEGELIKGM